MDSIEDMVGGRAAAIDAIALSVSDKKQEHFLRLLSDPSRATDNIATIARDAGLLPTQVLDLFRSASHAKNTMEAMIGLYERIPAIVGDLADKSLDAEITCPECLGTTDGHDAENPAAPCEKCHGRGTIMRSGDLDHKKVALEMAGMLKKTAGVNVIQQNNNVTTAAPGAFFSKFVKSTDADAYNVTAEAIDAEVEEEKVGG